MRKVLIVALAWILSGIASQGLGNARSDMTASVRAECSVYRASVVREDQQKELNQTPVQWAEPRLACVEDLIDTVYAMCEEAGEAEAFYDDCLVINFNGLMASRDYDLRYRFYKTNKGGVSGSAYEYVFYFDSDCKPVEIRQVDESAACDAVKMWAYQSLHSIM